MDSYKENIFEPLEYYVNTAKQLHKDNALAHFEALKEKSGINVEENQATVKKYRSKLSYIEKLNSKLNKTRAIRVVTIILFVITLIVALGAPVYFDLHNALKISIPLSTLVIGIVIVVMIFKSTRKTIDKLKDIISKAQDQADKLRAEAEAQMLPLNSLFSDDDAYDLIEKTLPQVKFDRCFVTENLQDLKNNYNFNGVIGSNSSVFDVLSGTLYKNPFLFERFVTQTMEQHTYTGTLVISWTTYTTDSKGRRVSRRHTQTLVASLVRPRPVYNVTTLLNYGSQAAPDLTFSRENKHYEDMSENAVERHVKKGKKKLRKKAEEALSNGSNFTEMSNATFDVLFDATNRDNEQQFRFMFTPLAQKEMIDLIRSSEGYGDDFDFFKNKKLNTIRSEHAQSMTLYPSASNYYSFDFEEIKNKFINFNCEYFKAIYFDFAPLISIPAYQEHPATSFEEAEHPDIGYTEYNYEAIANKMGAGNFAPADATTDCILKTSLVNRGSEYDTVAVTAYSFRGEPRTDFIPMRGRDGRMHSVPVHWIQYIPVQRTSLMNVKNIGINETEFKKRSSGYANSFIPENATCFRGMFAHLGKSADSANDFLNSIIN